MQYITYIQSNYFLSLFRLIYHPKLELEKEKIVKAADKKANKKAQVFIYSPTIICEIE